MKKTFRLVIIVICLTIVFVVVWYWSKPAAPASSLDAFARCLVEKGAVMYGAEWCGHCQNQKRVFGQSWRLIPYVECPAEPQKCLALGVQGYPTWILPDGTKFEGEQGLKNLSQASGCPLDQLSTP